MPLSIFKIRNVRGANLIMAPLYASMLGAFFLLTLYIQNILHLSPLVTGLSFLPFPVVLGLMSTRMPGLVQRSAVAATFAATLELVRAGKLQLRQDVPFGPIYLRSPPNENS